jgi:hypothetical protein
MIFAAIDYFNYRRQRSRYSLKNETDPMTYAFKEELPDSIVSKMNPGDVILSASYDWWVSWAIMYLTSSQISHLAIYVGNQEILHETLSDSVKEPIEALFGPKTRLIVGRFRQKDGQEINVKDITSKYVGIRYAIEDVILKGIRIITGRDWPYFRWKFYIDITILFFILDVPFMVMIKLPIFSLLSIPYLLLVIRNSLLWRKRPLSPFEKDVGKPCDMLRWLILAGGSIILNSTPNLTNRNKK